VTGATFFEVPRGGYDVLRIALEQARLPTDDLDGPDRCFFGLSDQDGPIGYIGVEGSGEDRLLRSLVVLPSRRGHGHGVRLVRDVESMLAGHVRLHLLTNTATDFFRALGFAEAARAEAPDNIASTQQFSSLCPASAAYLVKDLR
jgi:N-acetylglutamate synthase-like GNAT family acetyltransferase